jgi:hypothetical protein
MKSKKQTQAHVSWNLLHLWKIMIAFVLIFQRGIVPVNAAGTNWYVSTSGSDSNNCLSSGSACRTIQGAINKASSGDTVHVRLL